MNLLSNHLAKARCRGLAMVELTIAIPVFLMLLMATAEFGRAFLQYNALSKGVRDGARYVAGKALSGSTGVVTISAALQTQTRNVVVYGNTLGTGTPILPGLTTAQVTVANAGLQNVMVTANYPYAPIFGFLPAFIYGSGVDVSGRTLRTAITMRAL
jgi:Flp pilus assembly protein TadG